MMLDKIKFKKLWFVLLVLPLLFTPVNELDGDYLGITLGPLFMPLSWEYAQSGRYWVDYGETEESEIATYNGESFDVLDGKGGLVRKKFREGDVVPDIEGYSSEYFKWTFHNYFLESTRWRSSRRFSTKSYNENGDIAPWIIRPGFWLDYIVEHQISEYEHDDLYISWSRIAYWEAWMLAICVVVNRKRLLQDKEQ